MADGPVVVMGAGPIGLAIAYELALQDVDVVVVEREAVGSGSARTNAGWIVPIMSAPVPAPGVVAKAIRWMTNPESPLRVAPDVDPGHWAFMAQMLRASTPARHARGLAAIASLARGTLDLYARYHRDGVDFEMHHTGVLLAFLSARERDAHRAEYSNAAEFGYAPVIDLDGIDVRECEPALSPRVTAGLLSPDQAFVDPGTLVDGLAQRLTALGVPVLTQQADTGIATRSGGAVVVSISTGSIAARRVIIAAGVASRPLASSVGYRMPLRFGKGYGFDLRPPSRPPRQAVYLSEAKVAVTPLARGLRLAGTMEFGGDPHRVDARRAHGIVRSSADYLDGDLGRIAPPWSGLRPMTPDGLPVIGAIPDRPEIILATGHAMLGVTLAPRTAEVVAELVRTDTTADILAPFSPGRFSQRRSRHR